MGVWGRVLRRKVFGGGIVWRRGAWEKLKLAGSQLFVCA